MTCGRPGVAGAEWVPGGLMRRGVGWGGGAEGQRHRRAPGLEDDSMRDAVFMALPHSWNLGLAVGGCKWRLMWWLGE
jgi:hypothetical protein